MRIDLFLLKTIAISFLIAIVACGGPNKALISQSEITTAQQKGNLDELYNKANGLVSTTSGSSNKEAVELRSKIADILIADKDKEVNAILAKHHADPTSVSRTELQNTLANLSGMKDWSLNKYTVHSENLQRAIVKVNEIIAKAIKQSQLVGTVLVTEIKLLEQAADIAGEGQKETINYQTRLAAASNQFLVEGNDALTKHLYRNATIAAENGLTLDPGNIQFEAILSQSQAGEFENSFRSLIENGKPELAYQALLEVSDKPMFIQIKKSMGNSILVLASYFSGMAKKAYDKGDLASAYLNFQRGRTIQDKLTISQKGFIEEKRFLDLVMAKARNKEFKEGKRQALMRIVNEFDPHYPGLSSEFSSLSSEIKNRAMTKLSVAEFKEVLVADADVATVGRRISSKLEKILFERLGNEVLIVTDLEQLKEQTYSGLGLKINGEVLQAAIESSNNQGKRAQVVQTGVNRVETEDYQDWAKRKRGDAPRRYDETPINEEVVLIVNHIRKQAIAEISVRVIEPSTGKILATESFVKESEFSGESINEYQKGDFNQPYVRADLPSNIKIIDALASDLAMQLGDKLTDYLQNPDQIFYQKYEEAKSQGESIVAIELLSNALIIAESKQAETGAWYQQLKELVLQ